MRLLPFLVIALFLSSRALAGGNAIDCKDGGNNQMEMNFCSAQATSRAKALLEELDAFLGKNDDDEGRSLRSKAQRSFFEYASDQCNSYADGYRGGSIQPLIRNSCFRSLVLERANWLVDGMCSRNSEECVNRKKPWRDRLKALEESN